MFRLREFLKENNVTDNKQAYSLYDIAVSKGYDKCADSYKRAARNAVKSILAETTSPQTKVDVVKKIDSKGVVDATIRSTYEIKSVEEMAKYCSVDLKLYEASAIIAGHYGNGASGGNNNNFQFKVRFSPIYKKGELTPYDAADIFKNLIKDVEPFKPQKQVKQKVQTNRDVILGVADWHISSLAWSEESSKLNAQNNDLKIAQQRIYKAMDYYYNYYKDKHIRTFVIPLGNDFFDVNDEQNSTVNQTIQSFDNRVRKMFSVGIEIMVHIIDMFKSISVKVLCPYIPANHDMDTSFYLSKAMEQSYKNTPDVIIDARPQDRKYFSVGDNTGIMMLHGKTIGKAIKAERLPAIFANEAPKEWANNDHREILLGHVHHLENLLVKDCNSTIVRIMPTITVPNFWSESNGFSSEQQMEAYMYGPKGIEEIKIYRP